MYLDLKSAAVLTLYRRHTRDCSFFYKPRHAKGAHACKAACTIWVQRALRGEYIRRSLDLTSWQAASELVRRWEASRTIGVVKPDIPTVAEAVTQFFADAIAQIRVRRTWTVGRGTQMRITSRAMISSHPMTPSVLSFAFFA